jgi:hypothetical protein
MDFQCRGNGAGKRRRTVDPHCRVLVSNLILPQRSDRVADPSSSFLALQMVIEVAVPLRDA